jgi:hypothetical protein
VIIMTDRKYEMLQRRLDIDLDKLKEFSIKRFKTFRGMEDEGFNAELYKGSKKVGFIIYGGDGGDTVIEWDDEKIEKEVDSFLSSLPMVKSTHIKGFEYNLDEEFFVQDLIKIMDEEKEMNRLSRNKILAVSETCKCGKVFLYDRGKFTDDTVIESGKKRGENLKIVRSLKDWFKLVVGQECD